MRWFIRMAQWARHPPPKWKVKLVFGVVLVCLVIYGIELIWGWPEFLTLNRIPRGIKP